MKGYKGYENDLTCKDKQYAENTVFKEKEANICKNGMHFCKNPFNVLDYYPLIDSDGTLNEFTDVEALEQCETKDNKIYCTTKLKVGHKLGITGFVEACVEYFKKEIKDNDSYNNVISDGRDSAQIASFCDSAQIANSGDYAQVAISGDTAQIANSGDNAKIANSGYSAYIASSGQYAQIANSGDYAQVASSGGSARVSSSGYRARVSSSGDYSMVASSGDYSMVASSGDYSMVASSGDSAQVASSGYYAQVASSGNKSVIMCAGCNSTAKAKKGSWITLSEWDYDEDESIYIPVCVKTELVDGKRIKENTYYKLENGQFVETK